MGRGCSPGRVGGRAPSPSRASVKASVSLLLGPLPSETRARDASCQVSELPTPWARVQVSPAGEAWPVVPWF